MDRLVYERFGSRNGFVRYLAYWFLAQIGRYSNYQTITKSRDERLVFICNGNICRSPLAEVYAKSLGRDAASCGFGCREGFPADPRAIRFAESQGLSLESHQTVNISNFEFRDSDLVIVMEPSHLRLYREKVEKSKQIHRILLAGNYCKKPNPYIHDPFNCCDEFFERCESRVMEAVRGICG